MILAVVDISNSSFSLPPSGDTSFNSMRPLLQWLCNLVWVAWLWIFRFPIKATITSDSQSLASLLALRFTSFAVSLAARLMSISICGEMVLLTGSGRKDFGKKKRKNYGLQFFLKGKRKKLKNPPKRRFVLRTILFRGLLYSSQDQLR